MSVRVLPEFLINQIAAGEVVERPASVVKELVENALDAGAHQIVVDVVDGGRTMISVIDDGAGISYDDLPRVIERHATSKLPDDDLLNINFMGFRGEALPSIASVSDMTIDTFHAGAPHGFQLNATTHDIRPSDWACGTRVRVENLFGRTPARLKFLRGDRAEMMSVLDVVKRLAMARSDVGFTLNNKWRFPANQPMMDRIAAVMGDDVRGRMIEIDAVSGTTNTMSLRGYVSHPTLRRASSVDQFLFVNNRPVRDKVLIGALRAAYMDVMHAREFPLCALYLTLDPHSVDVNVSPSKTEVHFLEPAHVRAFIIKSIRDALSKTLVENSAPVLTSTAATPIQTDFDRRYDFGINNTPRDVFRVASPAAAPHPNPLMRPAFGVAAKATPVPSVDAAPMAEPPLGRVVGQIANKYIVAARSDAMIIVDQHAAHERITYERLRTHTVRTQPFLTPVVINMRPEDASAVLSIAPELKACGLSLDSFGDDAVAIFERPADWELDWANLLRDIAAEVRVNGHSSQLQERLHLKLANFACHHSVRAGQRLDMAQCDAVLRDIERTMRGGECNHGRPVYKIIPISEMDAWFERI